MRYILVLLFSAAALFGVIDDFKTATWNMQGSSASSEAKWSISVAQMFSGANGIDVLAIQEAGTLPATAEPTGREFRAFGTQVVVTEHVWNIGTSLTPDMIFNYFARTDAAVNRVNLAIAS